MNDNDVRRRELAEEIIERSGVMDALRADVHRRLLFEGVPEDHPKLDEALDLILNACREAVVGAYGAFLALDDLERIAAPLRDPEYVEALQVGGRISTEAIGRALEEAQPKLAALFADQPGRR